MINTEVHDRQVNGYAVKTIITKTDDREFTSVSYVVLATKHTRTFWIGVGTTPGTWSYALADGPLERKDSWYELADCVMAGLAANRNGE
jgi:hypothetical protein